MLPIQFVISTLILTYGTLTTTAQTDEDSLKLAWAVRKLVGGTCNTSEESLPTTRPQWLSRPGKIGPVGPPGPKGDRGPIGQTGACECDASEVKLLKENVARLENKLSTMEALFPEALCLLGMKSRKIPDSAITASSVHPAGYCQTSNSRLDHYGGWCCNGLDAFSSEWIEVDLGQIYNVTGVVTQGESHLGTNEWVTSFKIEYGTRPGARTTIVENRRAKVFPANFDKNTKVVTRFPESVEARFIRIMPASYHNYVAMRFDFINC